MQNLAGLLVASTQQHSKGLVLAAALLVTRDWKTDILSFRLGLKQETECCWCTPRTGLHRDLLGLSQGWSRGGARVPA